jgi:hypothetical protein
MTVWGITAILALVVIYIVNAEIRCGRKTKHFLEVITPEIDNLKNDSIAKYRARFGRDPTGTFVLVNQPPTTSPARRWFRK